MEIFQFDFMIRAFIAGLIIGVIAPVIGTFLVVRRYSLMADTLAHVSLVGVAIGLLIKVNPVITAIITAILASLGIEKLRSTKKLFGESVLALFLSGSLAVAVVIIGLAGSFNVNLFNFLFGSITTVSVSDLYLIVPLGLIILITILLLYKELFFISIDPEIASAYGLNANLFYLILAILTATTISLSMRIVGILLIGALTVVPVLTAAQMAQSFRQTLIFSIIISLFSVIAGLFLSFYYNLPSGGTIVIVTLIIFLLSLTVKNRE